MHGLSLRFLAQAVVLLGLGIVVGLLMHLCHAKLRRIRQRDRLSRQVEDALVQNSQGLILNVHGIVKELPTDQQLSSDRDRVQDLRLQAMLDEDTQLQASNLPPESANEHSPGSSTMITAWRRKVLLWWDKRSR